MASTEGLVWRMFRPLYVSSDIRSSGAKQGASHDLSDGVGDRSIAAQHHGMLDAHHQRRLHQHRSRHRGEVARNSPSWSMSGQS
jgi:hypothetical protein